MSARPVTSKTATAECKRDLCADDIANLIQPVALELLGTPNPEHSSESELRFGSKGSLSIAIAGEKIGQWHSFEDGGGGGVLDLIARERGGTRAAAMNWLKSRPYCLAGSNDDCRRQTSSRHQRGQSDALPAAEAVPAVPSAPADMLTPEQHARQQRALSMWRSALPVAGTPAELHLRRRGLDPDKMKHDPPGWPETIRFWADAHSMAMIVAVNDKHTGLVVALQRVFLHPDGHAVTAGDGKKVKRALGPLARNAARLSALPDTNERWGLAEGVETALAAQQLFGFPVWAAISAGNMGKIDPPHWASEAFVFADHDDAGMKAATATATQLSKMPSIHRVQIIRAVASGADVADVIKEPAR